MTTLRIRGLYAAALTVLFRQRQEDWQIVQPDDQVRAGLPGNWRMDSPEVTIDDQSGPQGVRDTLRLSGSGDGIERALSVLQHSFTDIIIRRTGMQVGSMYLGVVGLVSRERRQSIVYLGGQLSGTLPMGRGRTRAGHRRPHSCSHRSPGQWPRGAPAAERRAHRARAIRRSEHVPGRADQ